MPDLTATERWCRCGHTEGTHGTAGWAKTPTFCLGRTLSTQCGCDGFVDDSPAPSPPVPTTQGEQDLPPAAVEAAAEALFPLFNNQGRDFEALATAALTAAYPAITKHLREQLAREIEAHRGPKAFGLVARSRVMNAYFSGLRKAARIVREGRA